MRVIRFVLLALGAIGLVIALPLLGFAALGFLGVLADVSVSENRGYGVELLGLGLPPLLAGAVLGALGLLAGRRPAGAARGR